MGDVGVVPHNHVKRGLFDVNCGETDEESGKDFVRLVAIAMFVKAMRNCNVLGLKYVEHLRLSSCFQQGRNQGRVYISRF